MLLPDMCLLTVAGSTTVDSLAARLDMVSCIINLVIMHRILFCL